MDYQLDEGDALYEECGVFGCVAVGPWPNATFDVAADVIYPALTNLQHRGQESAGIVTSHGDDACNFEKHRKMGLVTQIFTKDVLSTLKGNLGLGHTRYSTFGTSDETHCQPFLKEMIHGWFAVAHNGQLVNAQKLKKDLLRRGNGLSTASDTELIAQLLCHQPEEEKDDDDPNWIARICNLMNYTSTSYSLAIMYKDSIYGVRDPIGNRPLAIGKLVLAKSRRESVDEIIDNVTEPPVTEVSGWLIASESCCFQAIGAEFVREVLPGEIVRLSSSGVKSLYIQPRPIKSPVAFCIFEYVYFSRPDTMYEVNEFSDGIVLRTSGQVVYEVRKRCGQQLAIEAPVVADLVSTVPDSATPAALGYSLQSGLPYAEVLYKNSYIGRTFIKPTLIRNQAVAMKFGAVVSNVKDKRIVLVDDSIVRGTTMQPIVALLRRAGAKEVHIRIASPPLRFPCYMGINIPTRDELIANQLNLQQLAEYIGADSVVYLSLEGLVKSVSSGRVSSSMKLCCNEEVENLNDERSEIGVVQSEKSCCKSNGICEDRVQGIADDVNSVGYCLACLNGQYPVPIDW